MKTFEITEEENEAIEQWRDAVREVFDEFGDFEYRFSYGSIGRTLKVYSSLAGIEKDFTDYTNFQMEGRKIRMLTGCKTYGWIDVVTGGTCGDPECSGCVNINLIFKEEVEGQLAELKAKESTVPKLDPDKMIKYDRPITSEAIREAVEYVFREENNKFKN